MKLLLLFLLSFCFLKVNLAANILCLFSKPAYSHQLVYRSITEKLLEAGHKITLMTTHPSESEKRHVNLTLIDVSFSVKIHEEILKKASENKEQSFKDVIYNMVDSEALLVEEQIKSEGMQNLIKNSNAKFDLLILESSGISPMHAFAELFNIPVVGITSSDATAPGHEIMGNVMNPVAHPDRILPFTSAKTFFQRLGSCTLMLMVNFFIIPRAANNYDAIVAKHFPTVQKSYMDLVSNVDLQLINAHPAFGFIRPILPNTIQLGFLHVKPPKPLPNDLKDIVDKSKHGVIYISFGTVVKITKDDEHFVKLLDALSELPYDVLWKFDNELPKSIPKNVKFMTWYPQSDILAHPNVKLFITHGGQHSVEESIIRQVPMVICPFQGDQFANAERSVERGIAEILNIYDDLTSEQIKRVITEVISNLNHQQVFRAVTEKLLEAGHSITLLSTHPTEGERNHKNVTLIDVSYTIKIFREALEVFQTEKLSIQEAASKMKDMEVSMITKQISSQEIQNLLGSKTLKFDLLILEICGASPLHAFAEYFNIPVVGITSSDAFSIHHEVMGNEANLISHPDRMAKFTFARTFLQRLKSCFLNIFLRYFVTLQLSEEFDDVVKKNFPNVNKPYTELISNVDLLLVNAHPALGFIRPILPNTIQLGFLHVKPPKPLPNDLKDILDKSKHGVIYISFGTAMTSRMAERFFETFLRAFDGLPYDVLWKFEKENLSSTPSNVHIRKWFPQSDLLAHPNVKLFITHGGQHSIEEAILRRVPMIVCPFQGDQFANAERIVERKIARQLNILNSLDSDEIKHAINEVIVDESLKINVEKLAKLVEDVPVKSPEKALWYIEYVIRNKGAKHLRYPQKEIPFYQYHYYDIFLSVIITFTLILMVVVTLFKLLIKSFSKILVMVSNKYKKD
ncbi:CLUMA_CG020774, isoform A [Clunio marinus]|uniref:CLUMA_CG020774, isoform A n=1 Tax=Clunio marinus TaxID=568069 RepID=A0A1J1J7S2_9DIPT|nr:CLUMA_CG020774, isoform A [Clunio marinus]